MYSALHQPTGWTLPQVLAEQAAKQPDTTWITVADRASLSFGAAEGVVTFVDRVKDCIRRPGENIPDTFIGAIGSRAATLSAWAGCFQSALVRVCPNIAWDTWDI